MLKSHMDAVENHLINISRIPANAGHTLHRGTPRETFVKEFLQSHLSSNVAIGTGEIIDAGSPPRGRRNQYDIVIFKNNYPKLDFGGGVNGFLVESVVATIEVKSVLDQAGVTQSVGAAHNSKTLVPNIHMSFSTGWIPPKVINYVVGYDGPAQMSTVYGWIQNAHQQLNVPMPMWTQQQDRTSIPGTALDGIVLFGKGFVKLDNSPLTLNNPQNPDLGTHILCDSPSGNLLILFLALQEACNSIQGAWLDPIPYLQTAWFPNVRIV